MPLLGTRADREGRVTFSSVLRGRDGVARPTASGHSPAEVESWWHRVLRFMRHHRHFVAFSAFVLIIGGLYLSVLVGDRSLITNGPAPQGPLFVGDPLAGGAITLPMERLESIAWCHLWYPVIDPYQGYGIPLLADQGVPVYPPQLIAHLLFSDNYSIWNVLNLMTLAFGSYLVASSFGQRFFSAMAVGAGAALAGVAAPNLNTSMLNPLALTPFVLVAVRYAVDPRWHRKRIALLGVATGVALLCLSGFQEVFPLLALVLLVYTTALVLHHRSLILRPPLVLATAGAALLGLVVGLVGLLPTLAEARSHSTINPLTNYTSHVPLYWLASLAVPRVSGPGLAGQAQNLGHTVWTLGTPVFVPVVLLAVVLVVRKEGRDVRWYVVPSLGLVLLGICAFVNFLHVLSVLDAPFLDSIWSSRFLEFAWWIPWCLLLGSVITNVRVYRWYDVAAVVAASALVDTLLVLRYRHALSASGLSKDVRLTTSASVEAAVVAGAFIALFVLARWRRLALVEAAMAVVVVGSFIFYLPTNFYPPSAETATAMRIVPTVDERGGGNVVFFDTLSVALPTTRYAAQIFGPIIPRPYRAVIGSLFNNQETSGQGALFPSAPTLDRAIPNRRLVSLLRSLGVTTLITTTPLPSSSFGSIPSCSVRNTTRSASSGPGLCTLRITLSSGGAPISPVYAYAVTGASPFVQANADPVAVPSNQAGLKDLLRFLSPSVSSFPSEAFVTSSASHPLVAAHGVVASHRRATTEQDSVVLNATSPGLVVLRAAFMTGERASVDGRIVTARPVDGGLWTAIRVPSGRSLVILDFLGRSDQVELALAGIGLSAMALAWLAITSAVVSRPIRRMAARFRR
jgi:hypothetical protein